VHDDLQLTRPGHGDSEPPIVIATLLNAEGPTGVQTHFGGLYQYLQDTNRPTILVTPFHAPSVVVYPIFAVRKVIDLISGSMSVWWYRHWHELFLKWALKRILERQPGCIVYAQCPLSARAALVARRSKLQAVIMVVHFNESQADEWREKGKIKGDGLLANSIRRIEQRTLPNLDGIVYVSRYMKQQLEGRAHELKRIKNAVIPNFCRAVNPQTRMPLVDIINVGTLEPRKNQSFLLRTIAHASRRGRPYTIALVGDGPDRLLLEELSCELGIERQVRFMGHQPRAVELMSSARVYAHSATMENQPIAVIEAMSCGLPVLAPAVGGITEMFQNGQSGIFWNVADPGSAGDLLIRLLEDTEKLIEMGRAARARFIEDFETSRVVVRLEEFIRECSRLMELKAHTASAEQ